MNPATIGDPRTFPAAAAAAPQDAALHALAQASQGATTGQEAAACDRELAAALAARLAGDGAALAALFATAPSVAVARHLWRLLDEAWRAASASEGAGLAATVFAVPLVIVTGLEAASGDGTLAGVVDDAPRLAAILQEHGALGGNRTLAFANALVAADAIDVARLPDILAWQRLPQAVAPGATPPDRVLAPAPLSFGAGRESVHLRFLVGTALAKPGADLLADQRVGKWGVPLTQALGRALGGGGVSVLALPRAPQRLLPAVRQGRSAQRDVAVQLFAANAIRKLRAAVGEPTAVISAHRAPGAPGGGELRLSLSSPFEPRDAEGHRCPLHPLDRVADVVAMLVDLMRDCRVADIRVVGGVHGDRDAGTGLPLLFKPATIPDGGAVICH